ncbi:MAG: PD40 domain-containing protein [Acidobacteriota bacterium]|nr:MAG: PD40 domain-containing protein [Acidobacteriota bacterium]
MDSLPSNVQVLTNFGERAVWSPNGQRIAFVHRTLGDAFEIDVETRELSCLTCAFSHAGFFRVHYLSSGDFILIGPSEAVDRGKARWNESELWFLAKGSSGPPTRLGQKLNEGIAASRQSPRIAWSESSNQYPDEISEGVSRLVVADVQVEGKDVSLVNKRVVHSDKWPHCWLEAQDFRKDDSELTFSCYQPENEAEVMGVLLADGKVVNYTNSPGVYDEPEGIFPDGEFTTVECDQQNDRGDHFIDIWKLRLDGTGKDYTRLTYFSDFEGFKASNPVISPDGSRMAFQIAMSKDEAGVGYGILLMDLAETAQR